MGELQDYLKVFFCSMIPIIELRGSIPMGATLQLPMIPTFLLSVVGNMLPVPFILLFIRHVLKWMNGVRHLDKVALWVEKKAQKNTVKVQRFATFGLVLFVGIPLPGTGAWTGALVAAFLDMRLKYSLPSIFCGVLIAGVIMTLVSYGFLSFLSFLL